MCGSAGRATAQASLALLTTIPPRWQRLGYRSRAYLKLNELNDKLRLLRPGMRALELGSAPGSWTQVLVEHEIETLAIDKKRIEMQKKLLQRVLRADPMDHAGARKIQRLYRAYRMARVMGVMHELV